MKKIFHETVNFHIMQYLNNIDYGNFYQDIEGKESIEYYVPMEIEGYKFEVMVEIERCNKTFLIHKDRRYYGLRNGKQTEFSIKRSSATSKTIQELFEKWLEGYFKWLNE